MTKLAIRLGRRIRELRTAAGLSQDKMSERIGISSKYLGEVERGEVNVTVQILDQIARAFDIGIDSLFENSHCAERSELIEIINSRISEASDEEVKRIFKIVVGLTE